MTFSASSITYLLTRVWYRVHAPLLTTGQPSSGPWRRHFTLTSPTRISPLGDGLSSPSTACATVHPSMELVCYRPFLRTSRPRHASNRLLLLKTLCLIALATGNHCLELAHLSRRALVDLWLPVMPGFLFKNQMAHRCPPPISFPSLPNSRVCPVATIRTFLHHSATWYHNDFVFINPDSHASMDAGWLKRLQQQIPKVP